MIKHRARHDRAARFGPRLFRDDALPRSSYVHHVRDDARAVHASLVEPSDGGRLLSVVILINTAVLCVVFVIDAEAGP